MKLYQQLLAFLLIIMFSSCKKFLQEPNKLQADIQTVDQLEALINNAPLYYQEANLTASFSTDDTEISKEMITAYPSSVSLNNLLYYTWAVGNIASLGSDDLWSGEYKKIFNANVVLANIDRVAGTDLQKSKIKADAYFIRAMSNWTLVNYYCLPYSNANFQSPGIPLKTSTIYTESLKRATLKETYDAILSDVEAAKTILPEGDVISTLRWRVSRKAIDAFLSRYYLFTEDYDRVVSSADEALKSANAKLTDLNTVVAGISVTYANPSATLNYSSLNDWGPNLFLYWNEQYYTRYTSNPSQNFIPSSSLLSLYEKTNDLRYSLFMIPNGGRRFNVINPAQFRYTYFNDGRFLISGPGVAEVLLNKAEALARKGSGTDAMGSINLLRQKRMKNYVPMIASSNIDALTKVLQERRRELPFAFRWLDIRRFSVNQDQTDDVSITREFYEVTSAGIDLKKPMTYTLPAKSLRYAVPINGLDIANSQGQLSQNSY